jgi:hypothetical protein
MGKNISTGRRNFLKMTAAGAAGLAIASKLDQIFASPSAMKAVGPGNKWPGRVVVNFNKAAVLATVADTTVIKKMVDDAILLLTKETMVGAAWKAIFPSTLSASSKIAIKIPIRFNVGLPVPHWSSVKAITDGLQQMDFSGTPFPAANITIYEMTITGNPSYPSINTFAAAGYTATNFPGIAMVNDTAVDGGDGALNNHTYAATLKNADFLISVFSPRGHSMPPAGSKFSLGFKNHFGTYSNPYTTLHPSNNWSTQTTLDLRDMNCTGPVYNKTVLAVCSGIYGMNEGLGPAGIADNYTTYAQSIDKTSTTQCPTTIIMSTDPVSAEMQVIKMMRINKGGAYATANMPPYLQAAAGMTVTGFTTSYNIGTIDEAQMDIRKIINGISTPVLGPDATGIAAFGAGIVAHQIKGHNSTFIEFKLPSEHLGKDASVEIYDSRGAIVRKFILKVLGVQNHFSWDETDMTGKMAGQGMYAALLASESIRESTRFMIVR